MRKKPDRFDYIIPVILAVLSYIFFFHNLGGVGLVGPDEPRYAAVARGMYESGDYTTPRLLGEEWFEKPPLMYWLAALGYALFGIGEIGARLPSALGATASIFFIYWCGYRLFGRLTGFSAAVILGTAVGFFSMGRAASMDMLLTASLTAALAFFLVGHENPGRARRWYFYGFYTAIGAGILAKGPVAVVLPALTLAFFLLWNKRPMDWKQWHPEGLLLTIAVAAPWYLAVTWVNGREFIDTFFINHNLQRFTSEIHGHPQPFYFYGLVLLLMMFPWTFLLIPAFRRRLDGIDRAIFLWALVPVVFFSLSGSKLPAYILPVAPPIALFVAREIVRRERTRGYRLAVFLQAGLSITLGIAFGLSSEAIGVDPQVHGTVILAAAFVMAAIAAGVGLWFPPPALGIVNGTSMAVLVLVVTIAVFPRLETVETARPWLEKLDPLITNDGDLILYRPDRWLEYGLEFYRNRAVHTVFSEDEIDLLLDTRSRVICIAESRLVGEVGSSDRLAIETIASIGGQTAFWVWRSDPETRPEGAADGAHAGL